MKIIALVIITNWLSFKPMHHITDDTIPVTEQHTIYVRVNKVKIYEDSVKTLIWDSSGHRIEMKACDVVIEDDGRILTVDESCPELVRRLNKLY